MRLRSSLRFSTRCAAAMVKRRRRMLESDSDGEEDEPSQEEPQREAHAERRSSRDTQEHQETKRRRGDGLDVAAVAVQLRQGEGTRGHLPASELLALLEQLDGFPMTVAVLSESGVAKAVKALRDHGDASVASAARGLFASWKREVKSSGSERATCFPLSHSFSRTKLKESFCATGVAVAAPVVPPPQRAEDQAVCQPTVTPAAALRARLSGRATAASARQAAQGRVYASMVAKFRGRANFTELTKAHVSCAFALIDKELLGGQLAPLLKGERRRVRFRVAPRMTARAGQLLTEHAKPREHELAISSTLLMQAFQRGSRDVVVNGCSCANRTEALLRVVEHEMIHLLFVCDGMPAHCRTQAYHGPAFCSAVKKLFGHKDYRHDLITPREVAAAGGLEAGCTVRFTMSGETLTGKVNRVTKRATVLVKCEEGHCDARQFSDGQHYRKFFVPAEDCVVLPG